MLLKSKAIVARMKDEGPQKLTIVPAPDLGQLELSNAASVDLRLGRWFMTLRGTKTPTLEVLQKSEQPANEIRYTREFYIPFGDTFWLHPNTFVLGTTLEWICLPPGLGGFVGGKSGWGRRGLIIETAASIHPGFTGCLTLEMTNLGEVPIGVIPGMPICQVVFHQTSDEEGRNQSSHDGKRKPTLGAIKKDSVLEKLSQPLT